MIKTYLLLTKPGIIMGNLITTVAGFALGSGKSWDFLLFLATLGGLGMIIASACVFNNCLDRHADAKMERTRNRPLVKGELSVKTAFFFALLLGSMGATILLLYAPFLATLSAFIGFFFYVIVYSISKYRTSLGTLLGSIAGAMPPVVGYVAASGQYDSVALLLFIILIFWQMPHFYSIALFRLDDYEGASIPVMPLVKGIYLTKVHMLCYIVAFFVAMLFLVFQKALWFGYLVPAVLIGIGWFLLCLQGFKTENERGWARQMFRFSLVVIMVFSGMISFF